MVGGQTPQLAKELKSGRGTDGQNVRVTKGPQACCLAVKYIPRHPTTRRSGAHVAAAPQAVSHRVPGNSEHGLCIYGVRDAGGCTSSVTWLPFLSCLLFWTRLVPCLSYPKACDEVIIIIINRGNNNSRGITSCMASSALAVKERSKPGSSQSYDSVNSLHYYYWLLHFVCYFTVRAWEKHLL